MRRTRSGPYSGKISPRIVLGSSQSMGLGRRLSAPLFFLGGETNPGRSLAELVLVFPYMHQTLRDAYQHAQGRLDYDEVRRYLGQAFSGVAHLHAHGVAHRDLSLSNFLLNRWLFYLWK